MSWILELIKKYYIMSCTQVAAIFFLATMNDILSRASGFFWVVLYFNIIYIFELDFECNIQ